MFITFKFLIHLELHFFVWCRNAIYIFFSIWSSYHYFKMFLILSPFTYMSTLHISNFLLCMSLLLVSLLYFIICYLWMNKLLLKLLFPKHFVISLSYFWGRGGIYWEVIFLLYWKFNFRYQFSCSSSVIFSEDLWDF